METDFLGKEEKKQKYLIFILFVIILAIVIVLGQNFWTKSKTFEGISPVILKPSKIEINFELLKSQTLKELQPFGEIKPFEGKIGRDNPFTPY